MTDAERVEVLALAYALLDGSPWYPGIDGKDAHCALTAFCCAFEEKQGRPYQHEGRNCDYHQLRRALQAAVPGGAAIAGYNDAPGRRKRDVLRLYEKAAAKIGK